MIIMKHLIILISLPRRPIQLGNSNDQGFSDDPYESEYIACLQ